MLIEVGAGEVIRWVRGGGCRIFMVEAHFMHEKS